MELAGLARRLVDGGRFDGIVCLGAVIRGGTPHFDLVAGESARAIGALAAEGRLPVAFGVLACDTMEQALERSGADKKDNRGYDAAMVVVEMADLYARLEVGVPLGSRPGHPRCPSTPRRSEKPRSKWLVPVADRARSRCRSCTRSTWGEIPTWSPA